MRYVVLDTNCLIQALPTRSQYHKVLNEYEEILAIHTSPEVARNVVEAIARHPQTYYRESFYRFRLLSDIDKDDDKFVDCAITTGADFIVTEDSHFNLLKSIPFPRINILSLDEFNEILCNEDETNN